MPMRLVDGDILKTSAEVLINPVNTVGIMGKGLALRFRREFPKNYEKYVESCSKGVLSVGTLLMVYDYTKAGEKKLVINFPTKNHWREASEYEFIDKGLDKLVSFLEGGFVKSIAIPALGCGLGGLEWNHVQEMLEKKLNKFSDIDIVLYQPVNN